jgi:3',5'-cyclic-AMP phosphodiesterase
VKRTPGLVLAALLSIIAAVAPAGEEASRKPVLTFGHITDVHLRPEFDAPARFRTALRHMRAHYPDVALVLDTGDTVDGVKSHDDAVAKWGFWKAGVEAELKGLPVYGVIGNHDAEGPAGDPLCGKESVCRTLGMPARYYSFDRAGWRFIVLDGNGIAKDAEQAAWLEKQLASAPGTNPVLIASHQPIFSAGALVHSPGDIMGNWKNMVALFVKYPNVKLCLSGHVHLYDKVWYNGVSYVCGGAMSGYWWEREKSTDGRSAYHETRPGYGIVRLYADGSSDYEYVKFED